MQSKTESFIESFVNIFSGFVISLLLQIFVVAPLFKLQLSFTQNIAMTLLYTVVSIIRSYLWRRYFNQRLMNKLHAMSESHNKNNKDSTDVSTTRDTR